jgi:hypothetical protein
VTNPKQQVLLVLRANGAFAGLVAKWLLMAVEGGESRAGVWLEHRQMEGASSGVRGSRAKQDDRSGIEGPQDSRGYMSTGYSCCSLARAQLTSNTSPYIDPASTGHEHLEGR